MDDSIYRMIFDRELSYEPVSVYTEFPIVLPTPSLESTVPTKINISEKFIFFTDTNAHDSLFLSTASIFSSI